MARLTEQQWREVLGADLALDYALGGGFWEDADLRAALRRGSDPRSRDIGTKAGVANLEQALANRLKTRRGELEALGHPTYGSRHHELVGEPNVERTRNLVKLYVLQALRDEPRVKEVLEARVEPEHDPPRSTVRIELRLRVDREAQPLALSLPFSLEGSS